MLAATSDGRGRAYRMGGDEFCALLAPADVGCGRELARCAAALTEQGDGFTITCSFGAIAVPGEAADAADALRLADQRMYAHKHGGRASASRQAATCCCARWRSATPELGDHVRGRGRAGRGRRPRGWG